MRFKILLTFKYQKYQAQTFVPFAVKSTQPQKHYQQGNLRFPKLMCSSSKTELLSCDLCV